MTSVRRFASLATILAVFTAGLPAQSSPRPAPGEGTIAARLDQVPATARPAWEAYVARSRELAAQDRAAMGRELAAAGRDRMRRAPYAARPFAGEAGQPAGWLAGADARALAHVVASYQTPAGGWSKRVAYDSARAPGQSWYSESDGWSYIGTLDNGATTSQLRFVGRVAAAQGDSVLVASFLRGLGYLLDAQYPSGCWPQVYPLQGGYHDAATFNDDATTNALRTLDAVAAGEFPFVPPDWRSRAAAGARRGVDCILDAQVLADGRRTVWGQQHDPITLAPVAARSYEPRSLSGRESAGIMTYLMSIAEPDARVAEAIHAAAAHFRRTAIHGHVYDADGGLRAEAGARPLWARMLELGTHRPIFANRDGVILYDWGQLTDRRTGYAWFGTEPGSALEKYAKWRRAHPQFVPPLPVEKS